MTLRCCRGVNRTASAHVSFDIQSGASFLCTNREEIAWPRSGLPLRAVLAIILRLRRQADEQDRPSFARRAFRLLQGE